MPKGFGAHQRTNVGLNRIRNSDLWEERLVRSEIYHYVEV